MVTVNFINATGVNHRAEASAGETLFSVARDAKIAGIEGECGGFCNCATCHVYVLSEWTLRINPMEEQEDAMLDGTVSDRLPTSRLACQVMITDDMDGFEVKLPERQTA